MNIVISDIAVMFPLSIIHIMIKLFSNIRLKINIAVVFVQYIDLWYNVMSQE